MKSVAFAADIEHAQSRHWQAKRKRQKPCEQRASGEGLEGGGFGVVGGDGFDEAGDGEGVADTAGFADEAKDTAFAAECDGDANERGDAGTVNLRHAVEDHNDFARAALQNRLKRHRKLFARIADGQAAVYVEDVDASVFANVDFDGRVKGHRSSSDKGRKALYDDAAGKEINEIGEVA